MVNPAPHPVFVVNLRSLGSMIINVDGNTLNAQYLDDNNEVRDDFTIVKPENGSVQVALISQLDSVGTAVTTVAASGSGTLSYSIAGGNEGGEFTIDSSTGIIRTAATLDYQADKIYNLTIGVTEDGVAADPVLVTVNVTTDPPATNLPPALADGSFEIFENLGAGAVVGVVTATDPDVGDVLTYSIVDGNLGGAFSINSSTGEITTLEVLDFEALASYFLTVAVSDNGTPQEADTASITINVGNVNEAPVLADIVRTGAEETIAYIGTIAGSGVDPDAGDVLSYSKVSGSDWLNVAADGTLSGTPAIGDAGVHGWTIRVTDSGGLAAEATLEITVTTNSPPFTNDAVLVVSEDSVIGTVVGTVVAADPDEGDLLTFLITEGNESGAFALNPDTGEISTATALNFESVQAYGLTVSVTDDGSPQGADTAAITINVGNVNEAPGLANSIGADGKETIAYAGAIAGSDPDVGDTLSYTKLSGPAWLNVAADGTLSGTPAIGDAGDNLWTVRVTDSGGLNADATLQITVTANGPPIANDAILSVPENSTIGTVVGNVVATDPDAGDTLSYVITGGNASGAFAVNAGTGELTTIAELDYETLPGDTLVVTVTDDGSPQESDTASITINVDDVNEAPSLANQVGEAGESGLVYSGSIAGGGSDPDANDELTYQVISGPAWLAIAADGTLSGTPGNGDVGDNLWTVRVTDSGGLTADATLEITITVNSPPVAGDAVFSVPEDGSIGSAVGTVVASDPDAGDVLTFAITSGNDTGAFDINASTGEITTVIALDFEMTSSYGLIVSVTDDGPTPETDTANITINVDDVNEAPSLANSNGVDGEETVAYNGSIAGTGSDPDTEDILTYSKVSGPVWLNVAADGILTGTPALGDAGDNLWTIRVTDSGGLTAEANLGISVSANSAPVANDAVFSIPENSAIGTAVGTVIATDPDAGDTLSFAITSGNASGAFVINASTGEVTSVVDLDYETSSADTLTVTVTDDGNPALSDTASVTIDILDVNEMPSLADRTGGAGEVDQPYSGTIGGAGSDPDANDTLTYEKVSGPAWLAIAPDGALSGTPASEDLGDNLWTVRVTDSGGLSADATLAITITVNNAPVANDAVFSVSENSAIEMSVGTLLATDPDAGDTLSFAITGGNVAGGFAIDASTGELTTLGLLDFEETNSYVLAVTVTDDGSPSLSTIASVTVDILDVNETPLLTNTTGGSGEVDQVYNGTIGATGSDPDANDTLTYEKVSGPAWLAIAPDGALSGTPASEDLGNNLWTVRVTDSGGLTADATLEIAVTVNSPPVANDAVFSVPENSAIGTAVGSVIATDPDAGDSLTFSITGGNGAGVFAINAGTGAITTAADLDFETTSSFVLIVTVTDDGTTLASDTASITINVGDVNEAPSLANSTGVNGKETVAYAGAVSGSDPDAEDVLSYSKISGPVWLNVAADGTLSGTPAIGDAGDNLWTVRVTDSGGLTADATLEITVTANEAPVASDTILSVPENSPIGTVIGTVMATDPDAGDTLSYTITGGNSTGAFAIDASIGVITTLTDLDFETTPSFALAVTVSDDGSPQESDTATITISVDDVNEAPSLADSIGADGKETVAYAGAVSGSDPDAEDVLSYSKISGPAWLNLAADGTLSGTPAIGDAGDNLWTIRVTDSGGLSDDATLEIIVTVNGSPTANNAVLSVPENSAIGTVVGAVIATDPDAGDTLSFAITGGNASGAFAINAGTGELTTIIDLDYETLSGDTLTVTVTDDGSPQESDTAAITINIDDVNEAPSLANSTGVDGKETVAYAGAVSGSDPDAEDVLSYSKISGPAWLNVAADGTLSGAPAIGDAGDNLWTVRVTDSGGLTADATLEITVTANEAPVANDAVLSVTEDSPVGMIVGTVLATDPDAGDTLSFAITGGNTSGAFAINTGTGVITTATDLDFETTPSFALTVTVTDDGSPQESDTAVVTINVDDVNEAPVLANSTGVDGKETVAYAGSIAGTGTDPDAGDALSYSKVSGPAWLNLAADGTLSGTPALGDADDSLWTIRVTDVGGLTADATLEIAVVANESPIANDAVLSVPENSAIGTVVGTVIATDPDADDTLSFAITGGNASGAFAINAGTGELITIIDLDYETFPGDILTVTVSDNGTPQESDTASITINVDDVNEAPSLANSNGADGEETVAYTGSIAGTGTDPDVGDSLTYSKVSGPAWLNVAADGSLAGTPALGDAGDNLWIIRVTDSGDLTADASLEITVTANTPPVANDGVFSVSENSSIGSVVGTVVATDSDEDDTLSYAITGGNASGAFVINAGTGELTTAAELDFETTPGDILTVTVTDDGNPALSDTANITVEILDVNEAPSLADTMGGAGEVDEIYSGSIGGAGSDPDADDTLTYSKVSGPTWLAIAPDGTLSGIPGEVDEGDNLWTVQVVDSGGLSAQASLEISVTAPPSGPVETYASGESTSKGSSSGDYTSTASSDNDYQILTEQVSGGKRKRSELEHQWIFTNVPGGAAVTLRVEAHHTANNEGDDFVFAYSTDGTSFTDVLTVTKTSDDNVEQTAILPSNLSGTIYVRVTDTDSTPGNEIADSLFVDLISVDVTLLSGPPLAAENPSPANGASGISLDPILTWAAGTGAESFQIYFGTTVAGIDQGSQTGTSFQPDTLLPSTQYFWRVDSTNGDGTTMGTVWNFTTGSGVSSSLFSDDFEDGNMDGWSTSGSAVAHSSAANSGVYGARLRATAEMTVTVDTTRFTGVNLKYDRNTTKFDPGEVLEIAWSSDGSTWTPIESTSETSWGTVDINLPASAAGQSSLQIRFKTNANSNKEKGYIDNVDITGT